MHGIFPEIAQLFHRRGKNHLTFPPESDKIQFATGPDSRAAAPNGASVRKVRAPQGKDNG